VAGIKESSSVNNFIVGLKIAILVIFIIVGAFYAEKSNWMPFAPFGWNGVFTGAALIFFAYIGFDAVSTTAEECKNPGKDLPFGIIGSLIVCTLFYILVSAVMTGICPYAKLGTAEPVATALNHIGQTWLASYIISVGAVIALVSVLLVLLLGQTRVFFSMSRDGFLPPMFSKIHTKYKTPHITTILAGILVAIMAGIGDIGSIAELCNIGTLFAFVLVCAGVIVLRVKDPDRHRSFRTPLVPLVPILGMLTCFYLMYKLPPVTWMRFGVWLAFGLIIYFFYGIKNTRYKTYNGDN
jgi:APA family basic amino acid/polyamine antiporter